MRPIDTPSQELLRELLTYDGVTGEFYWKPRGKEFFRTVSRYKSWNRTYAQGPAGWYSHNGKMYIGINYKQYLAKRLAYQYVHGDLTPEMRILVRNGEESDLSIGNLTISNWPHKGVSRKQEEAAQVEQYGDVTVAISGVTL